MSCQITSGFTLGCRDNTGGIKSVYILSGSVTSVTDASEGLIQTISGSGIFYQFDLFRQTSDFTEEVAVVPENGTVVYNQTANYRQIAEFAASKLCTKNEMAIESMEYWSLEPDTYLSEFERSQLDFDGKILFPETALEYSNLGG